MAIKTLKEAKTFVADYIKTIRRADYFIDYDKIEAMEAMNVENMLAAEAAYVIHLYEQNEQGLLSDDKFIKECELKREIHNRISAAINRGDLFKEIMKR